MHMCKLVCQQTQQRMQAPGHVGSLTTCCFLLLLLLLLSAGAGECADAAGSAARIMHSKQLLLA
jgi:hypothetical protein